MPAGADAAMYKRYAETFHGKEVYLVCTFLNIKVPKHFMIISLSVNNVKAP